MTIESGFMWMLGALSLIIYISYVLIRRNVKKSELISTVLIFLFAIIIININIFPIYIENRDSPSSTYYRTTYEHNSFVPFSGWVQTITHVRANGPYYTDPGYNPETPTSQYQNLRYLVKSSMTNAACLAGMTGALLGLSRKKKKSYILAAVFIAVLLFIDLPYTYIYYQVVPFKFFDSSIIIFQLLGMGLGYGVHRVHTYGKTLRKRRPTQQMQEE